MFARAPHAQSHDARPLFPALRPMKGRWVSIAIVLLALALRLAWLGVKPAHFDEGVNGYFVDQMTREGFYHYDPTNFHGPLHFYVLFVAQTLFGRHEWALRLPLALISAGCVALMLAFRPYFGRGVCQLAALAMAVSPGFVFYGRYAIHESELVFFTMLMAWSLIGLCHFGARRHLWAAGAGLAGMVLTKETWIIHAFAFACGYASLLWLERYLPSAPFTRAQPQWTRRDLVTVSAVCVGAVLFFYSGCLLDPVSLEGLWISLFAWIHTGTHGATGHEKAPWYWFELMARYEWPALLGVLAAAVLTFRRSNRHLRWLCISAGGALFAYSMVAYKTPWCLIAIVWPFYFAFAAGVLALARWLDGWVAGVVTGGVLAYSLLNAAALNFRNFTDETEPYVYVQTRLDINVLLGPLRTLVAADATNYHLPGFVVLADLHPLPWLLADFTRVKIVNLTELPEDVSESEFFLVADEYREEVERQLRGAWFRESISIRGHSGATQWVYLRAAKFGALFPGREPEFNGDAAE
jgi:uncharacterized protein (TIGR03663 family)